MIAARLLIIGLLLVGAMPVAAQTQAPPPTRGGFWLEAGGGTGGLWVGCSGCDETTSSFGTSTYLRGGGSFNRKVLWGIEAAGLLNRTSPLAETDSTLEIQTVSFGPMVVWYPWQNGIFVTGGVGLSYGEVRVRDSDSLGTGGVLGRGLGSGLSFGAGFDVPVLSRVAVTFSFNAAYGAIGDIQVRARSVDDVITSMYTANIALTLR